MAKSIFGLEKNTQCWCPIEPVNNFVKRVSKSKLWKLDFKIYVIHKRNRNWTGIVNNYTTDFRTSLLSVRDAGCWFVCCFFFLLRIHSTISCLLWSLNLNSCIYVSVLYIHLNFFHQTAVCTYVGTYICTHTGAWKAQELLMESITKLIF